MKFATTYWFKFLLILISVAITSFTLNQYAKTIQHLLKVNYNWQFEFFMVVGMLFFQFIFLHKKNITVQLNYYYQLLLVSLLGSILLWPLLFCNYYMAVQTDVVNIIYFFTVVLIMFFTHKKIIEQLQLPFYLSYTWVLYRFIILLFII